MENRSPQSCVLIVDDHRDSAQTIAWIVEMLGLKAMMAHDGAAAIESARTNRPDFIMLDIGLPGMSGYEICAALRQDPLLRNTVFIAQTGWGDPEHMRRSQAAGFDHHLVKPIHMDTLQQIFSAKATGEIQRQVSVA
jgi:CheY-like chemotaxis protein